MIKMCEMCACVHAVPQTHADSTVSSVSVQYMYNPNRNGVFLVFSGTETTPDTVSSLSQRLEESEQRIQELTAAVAEALFSSNIIKDDNARTRFFTGLPSYSVFLALFEYLQEKASRMTYWSSRETESQRRSKHRLPLFEELFLVLVRLRQGVSAEFLATLCKLHPTTFGRIFRTWIRFLSLELSLFFPYPSKEIIDKWMPPQFRRYPNTRYIIDCTEFYIERPSSLNAQVLTYSSYKSHNTFKSLIGVSPNGLVTYVSDIWGGRVSDRYITEHCGFLDLVEAGDNIMADRGFNVEDLLVDRGAKLNIPPFRDEGSVQLTPAQIEKTRRIATLRIHVERCIGYGKNYRILDGVMPLSLSPVVNDIIKVCFLLGNFHSPRVPSS